MELSILRKAFSLLSAQSLIKVISFFYTVFLARSLGVSSFGYYVTALAYFSLISAITDFGLNRFLIREGSRNESKLSEIVTISAILRAILTVITLIIFGIWIILTDSDLIRVQLSILAVLAVLPQVLAQTFDSALVAKQKLNYSSFALLGLSVSTTLVGIILISLRGVLGAIMGLIIGETIYLFLTILFLRLSDIKFILGIDISEIKKIIKGSLPYAVLTVLGLIYFKIDTLMLSYMKGPVDVGFYGAAYKFLEAVTFIPATVAIALFPMFSKLHDIKNHEIKKLYFSSIKILALISIPVFLSFQLILPEIIKIFLPSYLPSLDAIGILSFAIPFMFLHIPGATVLLSSDKYLKPAIILSIITVSFNIVLNLILIPNFGFIGASYSTVVSEALSFIVFFLLLYFKLLKNA